MKKELKLEMLDDNGEPQGTYNIFYNDCESNRMRLSVNDNEYIMDTDGKLVILTQKEIQQEARRREAKKMQAELRYYNPKTGEMQKLFN